jgi:glycosyltransferase involved in cell wall biosynthesis
MDSRTELLRNAKAVRAGRPLRVAIFDPFGNLYGSERSMLDLLRALPRAEVEPVVYCPRGADWLPELRALGIRYYDWFERDLHKASRARRMLALAKFMAFAVKERLDVVHLNQAGVAPYALMASEVLRFPMVLHSRWHEDAEAIAALRHGIRRLVRIVCISDYQRGIVAAQNRIGDDKLVVIRNPYNFERAQDIEPYYADDGAPPLFVCPARLHPHKRQDLLIEAARVYTERYGPCTVQLVGDEAQGSGFATRLEATARGYGLEQSIDFCGYQRDVAARLARATAMVLPSAMESLGRVVFEAWHAGTVPVAWAGSGGPQETIAGSGGGILYPEQTAKALAAAMHRAASLSRAERDAMIANGVTWLDENCAPERHAAAMVKVWREAAASR